MIAATATGRAALRRGRVRGVGYVMLGTGDPVTVFAHGLAGSTAETRPLAARLPGRRILLTFRGHGASDPLRGGWSYDDLADDLAAVAEETGATRALGVSLGAGALLRLVLRDPSRFDRLALVLPAALDRRRQDGATARLRILADAMERDDVEAVASLLAQEIPPMLRDEPVVRTLLTRRARALAGTPPPYPRSEEPPVRRVTDLHAIAAPSLVVAQKHDPLHPVPVARRLSAHLPAAELLVVPPGGVFWTARAQVAAAIADHLGH